jgi:2-amino-4-hydroxy-6-hydroxymethyldihydropteridine diphosphokinase
MAKCLLGLGSNVGDREAALQGALTAIRALPDVQLRKQSNWHPTRPIGGSAGQSEFFNGVVLVDTTIAPLILLKELHQIEERFGRQRHERWAARPLDIDVLLYDREVMETAMITVPHPRMTFRRFVLEPAAEVAPKMIHPIIGWSVERLLLHLDMASDLAAIVSPADAERMSLVDTLVKELGAQVAEEPALGAASQHWPAAWTTWLAISTTRNAGPPAVAPAGLAYAAATFPKLTILLDPGPATPRPILSKWSPLVRQPGRGPTLRIPHGDAATAHRETAAAIQAVWPTRSSGNLSAG